MWRRSGNRRPWCTIPALCVFDWASSLYKNKRWTREMINRIIIARATAKLGLFTSQQKTRRSRKERERVLLRTTISPSHQLLPLMELTVVALERASVLSIPKMLLFWPPKDSPTEYVEPQRVVTLLLIHRTLVIKNTTRVGEKMILLLLCSDTKCWCVGQCSSTVNPGR